MNPYWNQSCTDCAGVVNGGAVEDDCGVCAGPGETTCWDGSSTCGECPPECPNDGDTNGDGFANVTDVVIVVHKILNEDTSSLLCSADINVDGMVDVVDVVAIVNMILGGGTASIHNVVTTADVMIDDTNLYVRSEGGCVQGVQLELAHYSELSINLDDYFVSEYVTSNNTTRIMLVAEDCVNSIGNIEGDYDVVDVVLSNHVNEKIDDRVLTVSPFKVKVSGPNPFNPSTSLNVVVPSDSYVSVKIYNIVGQEVATLQDGFMAENFNGYTLNWNASNLASGVYLVRAEAAGQVSFEKLMLLK